MRHLIFLLLVCCGFSGFSGVAGAADQRPLVVNPTTGKNEQLQAGNNLAVPDASGDLITIAPGVQTAPRTVTLPVMTGADTLMSTGTAQSLTGLKTLPASTTSGPSLVIPHGTAPTTPIDGAFWSTTAGFFGQVNGSTVGPFVNGISGTLISGRIPVANGAGSLTDFAAMTFSSSNGFNVNRSSAAQTMMLGQGAGNTTMTGGNNVILGAFSGSSITTGTQNVIAGTSTGSSLTTGTDNVIIGRNGGQFLTTGTSNILLGTLTAPSSGSDSNNLVAGSGANPINAVYFGKGMTHAAPTTYSINGTGGTGSNIAGGAVTVAGGKSTGNAAGGSVIVQTSPVGGSGSSVNSLVTRLSILPDGGTEWTGITTASSPAVSTADNAVIFYDKTLQKLQYSANTSAFADLVSSGGVTTVGAVTTPTANGASITGSTLNLAAASQTLPGVMTAGTQNIGGSKTFNGDNFDVTAADTDVVVYFSAALPAQQGIAFDISGTDDADVITYQHNAMEMRMNTGSAFFQTLENGGIQIGNLGIATTNTDNHLYLPYCSGVPTGIPVENFGVALGDFGVAVIADVTNNNLYTYMGGSWRRFLQEGTTSVSTFSNTTSASSATVGAVVIGNGVTATNVSIGGGKIVTGSSITAGQAVYSGVAAITDAATIATDASLGNTFTVTLAGNRTMGAPTNPVNGQRILYRITQDGTGSRTLAWNAVFGFSTSLPVPVLTTTAGAIDYVGFVYSSASTKWHCLSYVQGF